MDTFIAVPTTTSSISLSPVIVDTIVPIVGTTMVSSPILPGISTIATLQPLTPMIAVEETLVFPNTASVFVAPSSSAFVYYDTGVGSNPLAQHETNQYLKYRFLDDDLVGEYKEILSMLKVEGNNVKVLGEKESDTTTDSSAIKKKIDFIGHEILTSGKNMKILKAIVKKNTHLQFYDLPHNPSLVSSTQAKYIKNKLREMRK